MGRRGARRARQSLPSRQQPFHVARSTLQPLRLLSDDEIESIHLTSLKVLEETGIEIFSKAALAYFVGAGADVDEVAHRVRLDAALVDEVIQTCPSSWMLHARNPARSVPVGNGCMAYCNATTPPYVSGQGWHRQPGSGKSFTEAVQLCQSLNVMHFFYGYPVEPQDWPVRSRHLDAYLTLATQSDKAWRAYALSDMSDALEMARIARGIDQDQFEREPSIMLNCNTNSPMRIDGPMCDGLIAMAQAGQPVVISAFTLAGAMAPVTMAGALVEQNAECLAGMMLTQLVKPGAPVVYGAFTSNVDMRSGAVALGTPEYAQAAIVGGQLARRYNVPFKSSNVNSSTSVDCQAAYESMMAIWGASMGGVNIMAHGLGWLESGLTFSFEKAVLDAEMLQMMQAFYKPMDTSQEALGQEAIARVGPGGHFFADPMTLERYETAFYEPFLSDWKPYDAWVEEGQRSAATRAHDIVRQLISEFQVPPMDQAIRDELESYVAKRKEELS